jgi:WD40 repeat protein
MRGHGASNVDSLASAALSPDGRLVVTAGAGGTAKVWDVRTGDLLASLRQTPQAETYTVPAARFSPEGALVAVVDPTEVNLYRCEECATPEKLRRLADERLARTVTERERARFALLAG